MQRPRLVRDCWKACIAPLSRVCWMVHSYEFDLLFVVPFALGVAFMLWVFWNLAKQIKR
jgi:hypothetical protein